jgi:hypothetical protein
MRRLLLILAGMLAALAFACNDDGGGPPIDPESVRPALESSALSLDDLPEGWTENPALAPPSFDPGGKLLSYCGNTIDIRSAASHQAAFQRTGDGPFIISVVRAFDGNGAERFIDDMREFSESCSSWVEREGALVVTEWEIAPLPGVEDPDAVAVRVVARYLDGVAHTSEVVLIQHGQFVTEIIHGVISNVTYLDPQLTIDLSQLAGERLGSAVNATSGQP